MNGISVGKRTGGLLLAVLLAALATAALISYVRSVENRAFQGAETVQVYVAREIIPAGTSIDEAVRRGAVAKTTIPRKVVADGAIASLDSVRGKVAAVTILKGEQIVEARFATAEQVASGLPIPADRQAFSIEVDTPHGVAGFVQPGSRVSIIAHLEAVAPTGSAALKRSQFLLQDIQVLAVGERVAVIASGDRDAAKAQQAERAVENKVLLTLAVTASEAERLSYALYEGDVHFTLLPQGQKPGKTPGRTGINVFR